MISKKHHFGLKKKKVFRKNAQKKFVDKNQRALVVIKQPKEENSSFWKTKWGKKIIEVCENPQLREDQVLKGYENYQKISSDVMKKRYIDVIKSLV